MRSNLIVLIVLIVLTSSLSCVAIPVSPVVNYPPSTVMANQVQLVFSRQNTDPAPVLANLYNNANITLDIAIYSLTNSTIVEAITAAKKRTVTVRVITDSIQAKGATQVHAINDLLLNNIPVKVNTHSGLMHLKMSVIDGKVATTGSYNYSKAASETNDEMFVVITESKFVASCLAEFNRLWISKGFIDAKMSY